MIKRTITGLALTAFLFLALWGGGLWFAVPCVITTSLSFYEMIRATVQAGHDPVQWPCWLCFALSIPLYHYYGSVMLMMPLVGGTFMLISMTVIFRKEPKLEDITVSCLPLVSVLLPGMCMLGLQKAPGQLNQSMLLVLAFGVPLFGDTLAYFIGSHFGKRKLCPAVSPNKSIEGAVAGLGGSMLWALATAGVFSAFTSIPPLWHFLALGLLGGVAGQMGDLFASLVKRHCGIKDFSNIIPGHGGMMDRLDSVYWTAVIIYVYYNFAAHWFAA
ncbi:MAG: phosphatidate cytidylyltransferase [Clostridia bacterium]|nr:phosphatidate cytidylyltransferase [Clostridia bacterium]MBR0229205.1 phosphatidate cytidylyltransferase [Clostridia bacterium]